MSSALKTLCKMMINNSSGYYELNNSNLPEISTSGGENSNEVDVLNTTPFSVRDILNIVDQNSEEAHYQAMNDPFSQRFYNNVGQYNNSQYKR